jgi:DNA-binding transcriptional LysR family regulator
VSLTGAGAALVADARETLDAAARLQRRARLVGRGGMAAVSVGFIWSTLPGYLAALVVAAGERFPEIELSVRQLRFAELVDSLRRGAVDLVITRPHLGETELVVTRLNVEPSVVALPAGHPLARRDHITHAELDGEPFVTLAREAIPTAYDVSRQALARTGITPGAHRAASSPSEALALVAAGLGIYYRLAASATVPMPGVVYRELVGAGMPTLLVRRPAPPPPALVAIADLCAELFGDAEPASNHAPESLEAATLPT